MMNGSILNRPPSIDGSFGGSQMWAPTPLMQNCGCGIVAGLDAIMRMEGESDISREDYLKRFDEASRYIRPILLPGKYSEASFWEASGSVRGVSEEASKSSRPPVISVSSLKASSSDMRRRSSAILTWECR